MYPEMVTRCPGCHATRARIALVMAPMGHVPSGRRTSNTKGREHTPDARSSGVSSVSSGLPLVAKSTVPSHAR